MDPQGRPRGGDLTVFRALRERWAAHRDDVATRAANGAVLLDFRHPGWERRVDRGTLDIASFRDCVLGQLYGSFGNGVAALWPHLLYRNSFATHCPGHGFALSAGRPRPSPLAREVERFLLRRAWVAEIERRRGMSVGGSSPDLARPGVLEPCR
jgi:hypothetical protein